jgi:hypothetical protein
VSHLSLEAAIFERSVEQIDADGYSDRPSQKDYGKGQPIPEAKLLAGYQDVFSHSGILSRMKTPATRGEELVD